MLRQIEFLLQHESGASPSSPGDATDDLPLCDAYQGSGFEQGSPARSLSTQGSSQRGAGLDAGSEWRWRCLSATDCAILPTNFREGAPSINPFLGWGQPHGGCGIMSPQNDKVYSRSGVLHPVFRKLCLPLPWKGFRINRWPKPGFP